MQMQNNHDRNRQKLYHATITAIGSYVPERILSNADLEKMVDTSHEWIVQRTGMIERRIAAEDEFTSHLCIAAVDNMRQRYDVDLQDVDYIIVATTTPDTPFPSVAALVQAAFAIPSCGAVDISASCAGFVAALHLANSLISSGLQRKILVIGAETLSKVTDYTDRTTCILFGDGAGAVLVERDINEKSEPSFLAAHQYTDGIGGRFVYRSGLSQQLNEMALEGHGHIVQNGREVYRWAVTTVPESMQQTMANSAYTLQDVDWFIPHSANLRMIKAICEKAEFPFSKVLYSLEHYGNTSAATIPLAMDLAIKEGKLLPGHLLLLCGFGAGLVQSTQLLRWTIS